MKLSPNCSLLLAGLFFGSAAQADVIAHWSFDAGDVTVDGGTGNVTAVQDATGNHHATAVINGTATGTSVPGPFGDALAFGNSGTAGTGNRYYLTFDNLTELMGPSAPADNYTVSAWVNTTFSAANNSVVADWGSASSGNRFTYWFSLQNGGFPRFQTRASNSPNDDIAAFQDDVSLADGSWHHVAWVFEKDNAIASIYVDGGLAAQALGVAAPLDMVTATSSFGTLGRKSDTDNNFVGSMDEIWVFDHALTLEEINTLRTNNALVPEPATGLLIGLGGLLLSRLRRTSRT